MSDWLTVGYSGEGSKDVVAGGPTLSMRLAKLGELELNTWESQTAAKTRGFAAYGVYTFVAPFLNVTATGQYLRRRLREPVRGTRESQHAGVLSAVARRSAVEPGQRHLHVGAAPGCGGQPGFHPCPTALSTRRRFRSRAQTLRLNMRLLFGLQLTASATMTKARDEDDLDRLCRPHARARPQRNHRERLALEAASVWRTRSSTSTRACRSAAASGIG